MKRNKIKFSAIGIFFMWIVSFLLIQSCNKKTSNNINVKDDLAHFNYFKYEGKDARFDINIDQHKQYLNPILAGYYPDPSICRKGDTYFLVTSSFANFPGVPIFKSKDLVNWEQIGHVLDRPSQLNLTEKQGISRGIYAPSIEYNEKNDTFYLITTNVGGIGNFYVTTKNPEEGWSDPILLPEITNIDPSFFFDDDGKGYIVHNDEPENGADWEQQRAIRIHEFDVETGQTIGKSKEIIRGGVSPEKQPIWIEAPHLYKIDTYYYLMAAEGGTAADHSEVIFRSTNPWGPYEPADYNPILTQRDLPNNREEMVSSAGHADLIETPEGEWWAVFLGNRPYDGDYMFNTGRETFLLPVEWEHGFPIILRKETPIPTVVNKENLNPIKSYLTGNFVYYQEFDEDELDYSWIHVRTPKEEFYTLENGQLNLKPLPLSIEDKTSPAAIFRRQQHSNFSVEIEMEYQPRKENDFAGLTLFQNEKYQFLYGITQIDKRVQLVLYRIEGNEKTELNTVSFDTDNPVKLKIEGNGGKADFFYSIRGRSWKLLARDADLSNLSTKKAKGFTGTLIGLYATKSAND